MKRLASSLLAIAVGLSPGAAAFAATGDDDSIDSSSQALSLDLLSVTDFALNPTDDAWISVIQQLRSHPCYETVGEEAEMCEEEFGLNEDLRTMLSGTDFPGWLHSAMIHALCGGLTGMSRSTCVTGVPTLNSSQVLGFQQQLTGDMTLGGDVDSTESNERLFELAGTPLTTRQNALDIIEENNDDAGTLTPHERATLLWEACRNSNMGQSGCYHSFLRYVEDESIDIVTIQDIIDSNGRSSNRGSNDDDDEDDDDDMSDDDDDNGGSSGRNY